MLPKISVIIPTYNRAGLVDQTVQSVLDQDFKNVEIIVVDDGSQDDTRQRLEKYQSLNSFNYFFQDNNGRSSARNYGISVAKGEWLMFLDSDDILTKDGLLRLASETELQPNAEMIAGKTAFIDQDGNSRGHFWDPDYKNPPRGLLERPYLVALDSLVFSIGSYIVRADAIKNRIIFKKAFEPAEDVDFMLRISLQCNIYDIDAIVVRVRVHDGNSDVSKQHLAVIGISDNHLSELVPDLPKPARRIAKGKYHLKVADIYYLMGKNGLALQRYFKSVLSDPRLLTDKRVLRQIIACPIPVKLKRVLKGAESIS